MNEADTRARASLSRATVAPPINSPFRKTQPPRADGWRACPPHLPPAGAGGGPSRQLLSSGPVWVWVVVRFLPACANAHQTKTRRLLLLHALWLARFAPFVTGGRQSRPN